ncbi:PH domain-containing protein [Candidatus Latescibacterota bacterium]
MFFDTAPITFVTVLITVFFSVMFFLFGILPIFIYRENPNKLKAVWSIVHFSLCCGFILFCFLSVPNKYILSAEEIIIKRYLNDIRIDYDDIVEMKVTDYFHWKGKNGWNPGVFGFVGKYKSETVGTFSAYITNWRYLVVIERKNDRPVIISPDKPDIFVNTFKKTKHSDYAFQM